METEGYLSLDGRLRAAANLVPPCALAADIGTDHGQLGAHLLLTGRCARVAFTDVSAPSLEKAKRLIDRLGLMPRADFYVGDGAQALPFAPDAAILAGMGGVTIAEIVERGAQALGNATLIMQPNVAVPALRLRLAGAGYAICDEDVAFTAGRYYVLIAAKRGEAYYTRQEALVGPVLLKKRPPAFEGYARFRVRVLQKALLGAQKAGGGTTGELEEELETWKEVL